MKPIISSQFSPYPDHYELITHSYLQVLDICLATLASIMNLFIFVAVSSSASLREKPSVIFILSLTLADLCIAGIDEPLSILVIEEVIQNPNSHVKLKWAVFYINWITCGASALSLLAASLDRLIFITFPFKYKKIITTKRAFSFVLFIWIVSVNIFCLAWLITDNLLAYYIFMLVFLCIVLISQASVHLSVIFVVRFLTAVEATPFQHPENETEAAGSPHRHKNIIKSQRGTKARQTAAVLIMAFAICWLPMAVIGCIWAWKHPRGHQEFPARKQKYSLLNELYFWCQFIAHFSSILNPLVFTVKDVFVRRRVSKVLKKFYQVSTQK